MISIREDSGIIKRCTECRRVLRDGECAIHGAQEGETDVRLRMVLDDGKSTISLIINKSASESLIGMNQDKISSHIVENGTMAFVQELRELLLGKKLKANGRTIVDEQGAMLLSDEVELVEVDSVRCNRIKSKVGWFDAASKKSKETACLAYASLRV